ncbi:hypothetical protein K2173_012038 [Erythroxylum novogranatense]|uniref:Uncharacterized protein n=1 Tax=Erythroxylum novogranatense TaxID=1862640 RepID=A0AAV8TEM4_9ROSI|nr:hypothetical protein K2173_012038 [Erythroxylum novogranatense]
MGSLEEDRLAQMVHDFIESESSSTLFPTSSEFRSINHQAKLFTLQEILGTVTKAEAEVLEKVLKHMRNKMDSEKTTGLKKWLVMRLKMDGFNASICHASCVTSLGCPAGDYDYIEILMKAENGYPLMRLIVDIDFKSQFELARPTQSYKELTDIVPSIFVGGEDKLTKIISVLCSAAKQSLRERGLHVPPWRTSAYMQSKWLSGCTKVTTNTSSISYNRETMEVKNVGNGFGMWSPPIVKPKRRGLGGGSGLSSQFSSMGINCC